VTHALILAAVIHRSDAVRVVPAGVKTVRVIDRIIERRPVNRITRTMLERCVALASRNQEI
jgi:primosomal replication protein N